MFRPAIIGWAPTLILAVCLSVVAVDVSSVPGFTQPFWHAVYGFAAVTMIVWRSTRSRTVLSWACGAVFVGSFVRAAVLFVEWDRWSGAALNVIICVLIVKFLNDQAPYSI
jgi:hypothetical protein